MPPGNNHARNVSHAVTNHEPQPLQRPRIHEAKSHPISELSAKTMFKSAQLVRLSLRRLRAHRIAQAGFLKHLVYEPETDWNVLLQVVAASN